MKSLVEITFQVLQSCCTRSGAPYSPKDRFTILRRVEEEGDSFLTITLPSFASAFDKALDSGRFEPHLLAGFKFSKKTGLPRFLGGFLSKIFNPDGSILDEPNLDCISCVRQICLLHKKILLECTDARKKKAERKFLECEKELKDHTIDPLDLLYFNSVSRIVWSSIFSSISYERFRDLLRPKHGPGVTAESLRGNHKYSQRLTWNSRLNARFDFFEWGVGSVMNYIHNSLPSTEVKFLEPRDELPSRVCFVPKTQKTPRVIAAEPLCNQYIQQALLNGLIPLIEECDITGGRVNFRDQSVNNRLALSSSSDCRYATLDLSEASDRVSSKLVWNMLSVCPDFRADVFACRTPKSKLPSGTVVPLRKFASMGSALCFPMEAMVFFCAIVSQRMRRANSPIRSDLVERHSEDLYIYGDDIIVPTEEAPLVCDYLSAFALKVNVDKSFWTGKFRESCGVDAYDGVDVTPVYLRHIPPASRADATGIVSVTAFINQLYKVGLWEAVKHLRDSLERLLGRIPHMPDTTQGVVWHSFSNGMTHKRWNQQLYRFEQSVLMIVPKWQSDLIQGDDALLKCFGVIGSPAIDTKHLSRSVRYGNLALKRRWIAA